MVRGLEPANDMDFRQPTHMVGEIGMSHLSTTTSGGSSSQLDRLCTALRGKLQFMDYLVRAAVADVERFQNEADAGTRIFLRQLIEMHSANLAQEGENMRLVAELCEFIDGALGEGVIPAANAFRNGDAA